MICQNEMINLPPNKLENKTENEPIVFMNEIKNDYKKNLLKDTTKTRKVKTQWIKNYCKCGELKRKEAKTCRKCFIPFENLLGKKFNKLIIIDGPIMVNKRTRWKCKCDCGNVITVNAHKLKMSITKSCGCLRKEMVISRNTKNCEPYKYLYNFLIKSCKTDGRGYSMDLTFEEFLEFTKISHCEYCKSKIIWNPRHSKNYNNYSYNLDRKNNDIGYTKENCVVCCRLCNFTKGNQFTYDEMMILGESIKKIKNLREEITSVVS